MSPRRARRSPPPGTSLEERVFRSVLQSGEYLLHGEVELLRAAGLTFSQYNVLRILRGARPEALAAGAIAERMIHRESDMTRILDGLQKRQLVARQRDSVDHRILAARITAPGLKLLQDLDRPVDRVHRNQLRHLSRAQLERLVRALDLIRKPPG